MISDSISKKITEALKAREEIRLSTLRMLLSALNYEKIEKQKDLTDDDEISVVRKEAKKRQDAIEAYEKAGAIERVEKEKKELTILKEYLPAELTDDEVLKFVDDSISESGATTIKDMGKVIGLVIGKTKGNVDGKKVAEMVKNKLATNV